MWTNTKRKNIWTKLHVDMGAKINTSKQKHNSVLYLLVEKMRVCPNVHMSINNSAGEKTSLTCGSCGLNFTASYTLSEHAFVANTWVSRHVFNLTLHLVYLNKKHIDYTDIKPNKSEKAKTMSLNCCSSSQKPNWGKGKLALFFFFFFFLLS